MQNRRVFLNSAGLALAAGVGGCVSARRHPESVGIRLPELPWPPDAMEPYISAETMHHHYAELHAGYVNRLNRQIFGTPLQHLSLKKIILKTHGREEHDPVYRNAAQAWNHTFYWNSMIRTGGGRPRTELRKSIIEHFGTLTGFKLQFKKQCSAVEGDGWCWLVFDSGRLRIVGTQGVNNPLPDFMDPLFCIDLWAHAWENDWPDRPAYVNAFLEHLVNWNFALQNWFVCAI